VNVVNQVNVFSTCTHGCVAGEPWWVENTHQTHETHPTGLADLEGPFGRGNEIEDGRRIAESLVKHMTGGTG
jgi:hypothetical protein